MKLKRKFAVTAARGAMTFTAKPIVPLPVSVRSATLMVKSGSVPQEAKDFVITINGTTVASGKGILGKPFTFSPPFKVPLGRPTLTISSAPYDDGIKLVGEVIVDISVL